MAPRLDTGSNKGGKSALSKALYELLVSFYDKILPQMALEEVVKILGKKGKNDGSMPRFASREDGFMEREDGDLSLDMDDQEGEPDYDASEDEEVGDKKTNDLEEGYHIDGEEDDGDASEASPSRHNKQKSQSVNYLLTMLAEKLVKSKVNYKSEGDREGKKVSDKELLAALTNPNNPTVTGTKKRLEGTLRYLLKGYRLRDANRQEALEELMSDFLVHLLSLKDEELARQVDKFRVAGNVPSEAKHVANRGHAQSARLGMKLWYTDKSITGKSGGLRKKVWLDMSTAFATGKGIKVELFEGHSFSTIPDSKRDVGDRRDLRDEFVLVREIGGQATPAADLYKRYEAASTALRDTVRARDTAALKDSGEFSDKIESIEEERATLLSGMAPYIFNANSGRSKMQDDRESKEHSMAGGISYVLTPEIKGDLYSEEDIIPKSMTYRVGRHETLGSSGGKNLQTKILTEEIPRFVEFSSGAWAASQLQKMKREEGVGYNQLESGKADGEESSDEGDDSQFVALDGIGENDDSGYRKGKEDYYSNVRRAIGGDPLSSVETVKGLSESPDEVSQYSADRQAARSMALLSKNFEDSSKDPLIEKVEAALKSEPSIANAEELLRNTQKLWDAVGLLAETKEVLQTFVNQLLSPAIDFDRVRLSHQLALEQMKVMSNDLPNIPKEQRGLFIANFVRDLVIYGREPMVGKSVDGKARGVISKLVYDNLVQGTVKPLMQGALAYEIRKHPDTMSMLRNWTTADVGSPTTNIFKFYTEHARDRGMNDQAFVTTMLNIFFSAAVKADAIHNRAMMKLANVVNRVRQGEIAKELQESQENMAIAEEIRKEFEDASSSPLTTDDAHTRFPKPSYRKTVEASSAPLPADQDSIMLLIRNAHTKLSQGI